jgi:hypothetical protein
MYGWNGRAGGEEAPPEVYVYYLEVERKDGKKQTVKGTVMLIR